ncbi:MAG: ParB/RepB/Spo0J family partition protein [Lachnospiraceae bacterium]
MAESIKENGILQNLTVVNNGDGTYINVIGHRRAAAARLAGLNTAPCTVVEMDQQTQASTMLLENMQRSDLTVIEEAQGFQMCLNLGLTEGDLSKKTGLSKKTVKHRVKLLELDQELLKEKTKDATIFDFIQLEKIKDINLRNKVLESMGTGNFNYNLQNAIHKEKLLKLFIELNAKLMPLVDGNLSKQPDWGVYDYVEGWDQWSNVERFEYEFPDDNRKYFLYSDLENFKIRLYREKQNEEEKPREKSKWEIEQEERAERRKKWVTLGTELYALRLDFIRTLVTYAGQEHYNIAKKYITLAMLILGKYEDINLDELEKEGFDIGECVEISGDVLMDVECPPIFVPVEELVLI